MKIVSTAVIVSLAGGKYCRNQHCDDFVEMRKQRVWVIEASNSIFQICMGDCDKCSSVRKAMGNPWKGTPSSYENEFKDVRDIENKTLPEKARE